MTREEIIDGIINYFAGSGAEWATDKERAILAEYNCEWDKLPCDAEGATKEQEKMQDELLDKCADEIIALRK